MRIGSIVIVKEKAGVISPGPCWVGFYQCWMHTGDTLFGLLWNMATEWKMDRHLVG